MNYGIKHMSPWIECLDYIPEVHPDDLVVVRLRGGSSLGNPNTASRYRWRKDNSGDDIVAYRMVKMMTEDDFINKWVDCKDRHPALPKDTEIIVKFANGDISNIQAVASLDWFTSSSNYKILSYKVVKV